MRNSILISYPSNKIQHKINPFHIHITWHRKNKQGNGFIYFLCFCHAKCNGPSKRWMYHLNKPIIIPFYKIIFSSCSNILMITLFNVDNVFVACTKTFANDILSSLEWKKTCMQNNKRGGLLWRSNHLLKENRKNTWCDNDTCVLCAFS